MLAFCSKLLQLIASIVAIKVQKNWHANKRWVSDMYEGDIERKRGYKPTHLREDVHLDHKVKVDYLVAARAKDKAIEKINGSDIDSFAKLPGYVRSITYLNPGSHVVLRVIQGKFYSMFVGYTSSIAGLQHCRPLIALDGTHLTSKYQGILLIAVGIDAENHLFPLGFGVVKIENHDNWKRQMSTADASQCEDV
jgi:hypothetical protein